MPSLKDIAADLGVSHALVSRVLNNNMGTTRVSAKTREAILRRAQEVDYQPNPLAVALKKGRKGAVGVFLHQIGVDGSELGARFIRAAGKSLSDLGLNMWLRFFESREEFQLACDEKLLRKIDGLIVAGLVHNELLDNLRDIESRGLFVASACHGSVNGYDVANFQVDEEMQCYITTKHLIETGCREIAHFYTGPARYMGYLKAHSHVGLSPKKELAIPAERYSAADGRDCMRRLIEARVSYDAICTQSDAQAAGALQHLAKIGIPRDEWVKITGIDDSPIARDYSLVPLTSATAEVERAAQLAVTAIGLKLDGKEVKTESITPHLVIRESTVPQVRK